MKKLVFLLALLPLGLWAQEKDSAEAIVGRYLKLLNYEGLPQDSMLVMETTVSFHNSVDTFIMRRWYATPTMMRVEIWKDNKLSEGFCTNGGNRHREYISRMRWWNDMHHTAFHEKIDGYDYRGQLFNWRLRGVKLSYRGIVMAKGQRLQVVRAEQENAYTRYYMFDEQSGLLVLLQEKDEQIIDDASQLALKQLKAGPMEYEFFHEYLPVGNILIPSQVSYMRDGILTIMETKAHLAPRENLIFNQD